MQKLSMLISEQRGGKSYWGLAQDIMKQYGKYPGPNGDPRKNWRAFIDRVLKHVYEPTGQWKTETSFDGKRRTGVFTEDGVWHPVLNRINTNIKLMAKLLEMSGVNTNSPLPLAYSAFIQYFRNNYRHIVKENGHIYQEVVLPTIGGTSERGEKTEEGSIELLKDCPLFSGMTVEKIGGSGVIDDMLGGVDAVVYKTTIEEPTYTIQIKPFSDVKESDYGHFINNVGAAKKYNTDFIAFINGKSVVMVDSKKAKPLKGSYFISRGGIMFQKGVSILNEDFDIIRNILKFN